jgi:protein disulfide-isomerase
MKKIVFILVFISFSLSAQELIWHTSMTKATELAIKEKKSLILFFTGSDWCGWCIRLQKEVLKTKDFENWAKDNAILVELDFPRNKQQTEEIKQQNQNLLNTFGVRGFPTLWFVNPTIDKNNKVNLNGFGSQGYVAGGPTKWLGEADKIMKNKPQL